MVTEIKNVVLDITSCNFCHKADFNQVDKNKVFPYKNVLDFKRENGKFVATICQDCLEELYKKGMEEFNKLD